MEQSPAMSWKSLNVLALTDSTGYGKLKFKSQKKTEFVHDFEQGIFHIISPGAALSTAGSSKRFSLAHALVQAQKDYPVLMQALRQDVKMEVIFIAARDSCKANKKFQKMEAYRLDMDLRETDFTIMSLESQVFSDRILELIGVGRFSFFVFCDMFCFLVGLFLFLVGVFF